MDDDERSDLDAEERYGLDYEDEPLLRFIDDGDPVDADVPLPPGFFISRWVDAEPGGYDDEGFPDGTVPEHIETIRITISMAQTARARLRFTPIRVRTVRMRRP